MSYLTKVDLAKRAKIFSGDTASFDGSIALKKNFTLNGVLTLSGVTQFVGATYKALVVDEATNIVYKTTLSGGGGADDTLDSDLLVTTEDVGGINNGELFVAGTTFEYLFRRLLTKVFYPYYLDPSLSLITNSNTLLEIGVVLNNLQLLSTFDRGRVMIDLPSGTTFQSYRSGPAISYNFSGATITPIGQPQTGSTYTHGNYTVVNGYQYFGVNVIYSEGAQPVDSEGNNYETPYSSGTTYAQTYLEGAYPIFACSSSISISTKQSLVSMITGNNVQVVLSPESGGYKQFFEMPALWLTNRPLVTVNYFNTVSNTFDPLNKLSDFTVTDTTKTINGNIVNYKKYTNTSPDRGILTIKLIF